MKAMGLHQLITLLVLDNSLVHLSKIKKFWDIFGVFCYLTNF